MTSCSITSIKAHPTIFYVSQYGFSYVLGYVLPRYLDYRHGPGPGTRHTKHAHLGELSIDKTGYQRPLLRNQTLAPGVVLRANWQERSNSAVTSRTNPVDVLVSLCQQWSPHQLLSHRSVESIHARTIGLNDCFLCSRRNSTITENDRCRRTKHYRLFYRNNLRCRNSMWKPLRLSNRDWTSSPCDSSTESLLRLLAFIRQLTSSRFVVALAPGVSLIRY